MSLSSLALVREKILDSPKYNGIGDTLLTPRQTAELLGLSMSTLARMRTPIALDSVPSLRFIRIRPRAIRYRASDVHKYIEQCRLLLH